MEGYDVITSDDQKAGTVVEERGDYVIVEEGLLRKSRRALPRTYVAFVDEAERAVRTSITKEILTSSPALDGDDLDERAVAAHYGLAAGEEAPPTEGAGEMLPDDPAVSAEDQTRSAGLETPEEQRARIRANVGPGEGPLDSTTSPGVTGGDRARDAGR